MEHDVNSLAHSKWNCKYHIVFAPKYRRQEIYGQIYKEKPNENAKQKSTGSALA